ncbi:hypothetical protein RvY_02706-2 [Ramazzottius varieornatus]|uniref:non-specific serine/threonine protein kinase n=1 Tax=Ramazzottius varieornatus TaxID=947166 RepID=A0A1D1UKN1_RAMVA|nr:hypothetical protein RvY_02706-2 [Ramazzottius varieornatus]
MHPEPHLRTGSVPLGPPPGQPMPNSLQVGEMPSVEPEPDEVPSPSSELHKSTLHPRRRRHGGSKRLSIPVVVSPLVPSSSLMILETKDPPLPAALLLSDDEDEEVPEAEAEEALDEVEDNAVMKRYEARRTSFDRRASLSLKGKSKSLGEVAGSAAAAKDKRTRKLTAYEQVSQELAHDKRTLKEITLGRRVGFYRIRTELGSGNFSQVKMAVHALTREKVAIKILDKSRLDQKTQRLVAREIANMERVHHPNIVRLYEVVETLAKLYLVMEYAGGGELFTRITNEGRFKEADAMPLFAQAISAMDHLHAMNIIHRDLKAENVFFSGPNTIKVGDFGFSTISLQGQALTTFCGSPPYAAPELFRDESYEGRPVDVWAMGIMLYFMVTGMLPFRGETVGKLKKAILEGVYLTPTYLSPHCMELITALLRPVASDRPSVHAMRRFPWLQGASYPEPLKPFTLNPDDIMHDNVPSEEKQARKVLKELGITRDVIQKSMGKQSRSSITGTYRIVLHRIQKQALGIQYEEYAGMANDATESAPSALNTMQSAPSTAKSRFGRTKVSPLDALQNNGAKNATKMNFGGGNKVSRLCVIL